MVFCAGIEPFLCRQMHRLHQIVLEALPLHQTARLAQDELPSACQMPDAAPDAAFLQDKRISLQVADTAF